MSTRDAIIAAFQQVAQDQGRTLQDLTDDLALTSCGLDSLSFAIVVSSLEDSLNTNPFATSEWVDFPVTFGDFVRLYESARA